MQYNKETKMKTIRLEIDLIKKIEKMAEDTERDFSSQIRFMIKEYIKIKENK